VIHRMRSTKGGGGGGFAWGASPRGRCWGSEKERGQLERRKVIGTESGDVIVQKKKGGLLYIVSKVGRGVRSNGKWYSKESTREKSWCTVWLKTWALRTDEKRKGKKAECVPTVLNRALVKVEAGDTKGEEEKRARVHLYREPGPDP